MVSKATQPETVYDFGGFSPQLYQLRYPAPGAPGVADRAVAALSHAGFTATTHPSRGFDHGTWTPLILAYPEAVIPVTQMSIQPHCSPEHHVRLGQALKGLRDKGVLIIGSGAATHNLSAFGASYDATPPDWVTAFDDALAEAIAQNDRERLLQYRQTLPYAARNHPSDDHLLPLFVALGAGGPGLQLHRGFTYGAFSMAAYAFSEQTC